jgi:hypothetical protein
MPTIRRADFPPEHKKALVSCGYTKIRALIPKELQTNRGRVLVGNLVAPRVLPTGQGLVTHPSPRSHNPAVAGSHPASSTSSPGFEIERPWGYARGRRRESSAFLRSRACRGNGLRRGIAWQGLGPPLARDIRPPNHCRYSTPFPLQTLARLRLSRRPVQNAQPQGEPNVTGAKQAP